MNTIEDYRNKLSELDAEYAKKRKALIIEYAFSIAKFKVGDIIKDGVSAILIDKITAYSDFYGNPMPVYNGIELKKDLTPTKKVSRRGIYGNDKVELITR